MRPGMFLVEKGAVRAGLGRVYGNDLVRLMLNFTDRVRLHGVRHQRQARPYWRRQPEFLWDLTTPDAGRH